MAKSRTSMTIEDGIIEWYDGPEWDDVAFEHFSLSAEQLQEIMQQDAIWEDRTGDARNGLSATAFRDDSVIGIILAHGVDYGFWLEVIQNGRFAIIGPTLEAHGRRVTYNAVRRIRNARKGRNL